MSTTKSGIWLDNLTKELLESVELDQMILERNLSGLSLNLEALYHSLHNENRYSRLITCRLEAGRSPGKILLAIFYDLARKACKQLAGKYKDSLGAEGYVCTPLPPDVALDTRSIVKQGTDFWKQTACENLMISVPATKQGIPAIRQLIASGVNVNVTMVYTLKRYRQSAEAYLAGLETLLRERKRINGIASFANVMPDSINGIIDPLLKKNAAENKEQAAFITPLLGTLGQATGNLMYKSHDELFNSDRFRALEIKGANPQGILWICKSSEACPSSSAREISHFLNIPLNFQLSRITPELNVISNAPDKTVVPDLDRAARQLQLANQFLGFSFTDVMKKMEMDNLSALAANYKRLIGFIESKRTVIKPNST